ncbi:transcription termination factor NusA [Patescibacteria group bacterium]|nr:transcription termination factor NusA [Patescibacteria group bacterium]
MLDQKQFALAINQIAEEKGISKDEIFKVIEAALAAAYKKDYGKKGQIIRVKFNPETGDIKVSQIKQVVPDDIEEEAETAVAGGAPLAPPPAESERAIINEAVRDEKIIAAGAAPGEEQVKIRYNPDKHIKLSEALLVKPDAKLEDEIESEMPSKTDFGRIASQTAKQVIIQRIREVERSVIFNEFKKHEGEVLIGAVQRVEILPPYKGRVVFIDINKTVGIIPPSEQVMRENYRTGQRLKVYVVQVSETPKGPEIILSRTRAELIKNLFTLEVPEIADKSIEIKAISREAGDRSKIAVVSNDRNIDPIGACVGQKGTRVQAIMEELGGEKIDIVEWDKDMAKFIAKALSPAKVLAVRIDEKSKSAAAKVIPEQLSLAIGKHGQNVRLASKLTGYRIDVMAGDLEPEAPKEEAAEAIKKEKGDKEEKSAGKEKKAKKEKSKKSADEVSAKGEKEKPAKKVKAKKEKVKKEKKAKE